MTRTAPRTPSTRKTGADLEAWLLGEPDLDADALALLAAYRDAAEAARPAAPATEPGPADPATGDAPVPIVPSRPAVPGVARLRSVAGIAEPRLAPLHGQLLAVGFLTSELLGRSDGLAYRVTREGLRRLAGESADAEAA